MLTPRRIFETPVFKCKSLQGCYSKLILPELHRHVERWYYLECRGWQRQAFKKVLKGIWAEARAGEQAAGAASAAAAAAAASTESDAMLAVVYARGVLRDEFDGAVRRYVSTLRKGGGGGGGASLEDFRATLGALAVVSQRRSATQYRHDFASFTPREKRAARPRTFHKHDVERSRRDAWDTFSTRHAHAHTPEPPLPHPPPPRQPQPPGGGSGGGGGDDASVRPKLRQKAHPPYALWFDPDNVPAPMRAAYVSSSSPHLPGARAVIMAASRRAAAERQRAQQREQQQQLQRPQPPRRPSSAAAVRPVADHSLGSCGGGRRDGWEVDEEPRRSREWCSARPASACAGGTSVSRASRPLAAAAAAAVWGGTQHGQHFGESRRAARLL